MPEIPLKNEKSLTLNVEVISPSLKIVKMSTKITTTWSGVEKPIFFNTFDVTDLCSDINSKSRGRVLVTSVAIKISRHFLDVGKQTFNMQRLNENPKDGGRLRPTCIFSGYENVIGPSYVLLQSRANPIFSSTSQIFSQHQPNQISSHQAIFSHHSYGNVVGIFLSDLEQFSTLKYFPHPA